MSSPAAAPISGVPPSPPSSHGSADFHPRGKPGKPADGNNNPGQQQVLSALQIKKEKFSQSQKSNKDDQRSSGSSDEDESTFEEEPEFIAVRSAKDDSDPLELPLSSDGSLTLATLQSYFSGATGLAKKNPNTGNLRVAFVTFKNCDQELALRPVAEGPNRERVWGTEPLVVVWPRRKRVSSSDEEEEEKPKSNVFRFTATAASSGPPAAKRRFQPSSAPTTNWRMPQNYKGKSNNTSQRVGGGGAYGLGTMHVKDMQEHMNMNGVRAYFEQFGPVHSLEPSHDPKRMIVRFATYQGAKAAFGNHHVQGVDLVCLPHRHDADRRASVFVHQIPRELSQNDLFDYFSHFGDVSYVYRPTQFAYSRFGFAFIQFETVADAEEASMTLEHNVRGYRITAHKSRVAL